MLTSEDINFICETLEEEIPEPVSELVSLNEYTFLVAVVLSAQTTDRQVNIATKKLFALVDNPHDMLLLGYDRLCELIKSIGFFRNKAKHVIMLSQQIIDKFDGKVPRNFDDLISLAGVGRKTANVILNQLFHVPAIAVDTHVYRVSRRLGLSVAEEVSGVEEDLNLLIPEQHKLHIGDRILLHGRYVCTAKKPRCSECKLAKVCKFKNEIGSPDF